MNIDHINSELITHTIIKSLSFTTDMDSDYFESNLKLVLCQDEHIPDELIEVVFTDVSNLSLNEIGGGLSQICHLNIEDIRANQLDRKYYKVCDLENDVISFYCKSIKCSS